MQRMSSRIVREDMSTRKGHRYMFVIFRLLYKWSEMLQPLKIIDWWELRFGVVLHHLINLSLRQNMNVFKIKNLRKLVLTYRFYRLNTGLETAFLPHHSPNPSSLKRMEVVVIFRTEGLFLGTDYNNL